ncbi:ArsR/SmtB family transcription factor [Humibacter ginsenosidimutans]|uniref:Winged helix-turn-helix transcriptional regulator n=1 Tax=Humibacter ginsenosidimutans TaxID=2599293 RepID=A0A5B8M6P4_9MICO|nr:metalloregulator ArsR/SmtB family transcription factor [Humibacter ginsenosidimutans]QDZ16063.1 winged helix-turn-helix transcriptional regulator [Humibacter ginsenosidimutans]
MPDIFDIVADATRRDILRVLLEASENTDSGEVSVSQIVGELELSQPTVSKHLKVLREAGLVAVREEGQHRYYHLDVEPLEEIEDWLMPFVSGGFDISDIDVHAVIAGLNTETKEFAEQVGKVFADTSHRVSNVVERVRPKRKR